MKNIEYYRTPADSVPGVKELQDKINNWSWSIPEGKTEITLEEARSIIKEFNTFESSLQNRIDRLVWDEEEKRLRELYLDLCSDLNIDPESIQTKELFRRATIKYPHIVSFIIEQFKKDVNIFIKNEVV